jgi:hypothetical protein
MPRRKLTAEERKSAAAFFNKINADLGIASPGAHLEAFDKSRGLYVVYTPNKSVPVVSLEFLEQTLASTVPMGEQALITSINLSQFLAYQEQQMKMLEDNPSITLIKVPV